MKLLICVFFIIHYSTFCQREYMVEIEMNRYVVNEGFKSKLTEILERVKPEDSKFTFIINVSTEADEYLISLGTTYDVDIVNNNYVGFFMINEKLFLIFENIAERFFKLYRKETVLVNTKKSKGSEVIVEPYIDELPFWLIRYKKGDFINVYSSY
jgi:hypothetical protein